MLRFLSSGKIGLTPEVLKKVLLSREAEQEKLFAIARKVRDEQFPSLEVEIRSVVEIGNCCRQRCQFCENGTIPYRSNFRLDTTKLTEAAVHAYQLGRRVIVIQSGETASQAFVEPLCRSVESIKLLCPDMQVILSQGSLKPHQLHQLKKAGTDRYILKFETSNSELYRKLKPRDSLLRRLERISLLTSLSFVVGSGNIVGLPGQSLDDIIDDLLFVAHSQWPMVSASVFVPGRGTALAEEPAGSVELTLNVMALLRILVPKAYIPTPSSLEHLQPGGQLRGLMAGANTVNVQDDALRMNRENRPLDSSGRFTPDQKHLVEIVSAAGLLLPELVS